jgi:hypothetical protein
MEKTFRLEQKELAALDQLEQEKTRALAQYGALSIDMKNAEQRINSTVERQQSFLRSVLMHRGVDRFSAAQIVNGSVICTVEDELISNVIEEKKTNGLAAVE